MEPSYSSLANMQLPFSAASQQHGNMASHHGGVTSHYGGMTSSHAGYGSLPAANTLTRAQPQPHDPAGGPGDYLNKEYVRLF